jgi:hypothetical protein
MPSSNGRRPAGIPSGLDQVQRQIGEAVDEVRVRIQEAVDRAQERAEAAADLAVKLAYASVGVLDLAQEEISTRVRRVRS